MENTLLKIKDFFNKHTSIISILMLFIILGLIFFGGLGNYYLMDVDETRYVSMARDMFHSKNYLTLYLNNQFFFEKPPLYFWQECLSFFLFKGQVNEWSARFPVALLGFILSFTLYFFTRKKVNNTYAIISSLILATSLEFIILSRYAILDIVLTFYVTLAILAYFQTYFCKESNKKYFWWLFYIFSGLAVMAKGIPGIALPFGIVFFISIFTKRFKENFKPLFLIPGLIIFFLITLPWHIIMLHKYDPLFFNEYIIKHHLHRFLNTENNEIGRKQPFYYYFLVISWGFIPWIFSAIAMILTKIKNILNENLIRTFNFYNLDNMGKLNILATISALWIMLFFSSSSTKLATYILPIYFCLAIIMASVWYKYLVNNQFESPINISVKIVGWIFFVAGMVAVFSPLFLPTQLNNDINDVRLIVVPLILFFGVASIIFEKKQKNWGIFITYITFMALLSGLCCGKLFSVDYKFGQNDLVEFAQLAKKNHYNISCFNMKRKYSLIYYSDSIVNYNDKIDDVIPQDIINELNKKDTVVIIKTKDLLNLDKFDYKVLKQGRRYSLLSK